MTDNEIIKALRCCLNVDSKCADCHFLFERHFCKNALLKQTLDLINRQQQENRQLHVKLDDYERDIIPKLKYSLERANKYGSETEAENIQLLKENENLTSANEYLTSANEYLTSVLTSAKAEIERLKAECQMADGYADALVKMTKAEAIKDFAERLKKRLDRKYKIYGREYVLRHLRELVKEMLGEQ